MASAGRQKNADRQRPEIICRDVIAHKFAAACVSNWSSGCDPIGLNSCKDVSAEKWQTTLDNAFLEEYPVRRSRRGSLGLRVEQTIGIATVCPPEHGEVTHQRWWAGARGRCPLGHAKRGIAQPGVSFLKNSEPRERVCRPDRRLSPRNVVGAARDSRK